MEIFRVKLDSCTKSVVAVALVRDVKNSSAIHKKVIAGELNCCVIKASLVAHPLQVVVAVNKAVLDHQTGHAVTKNINTEILFNLSISKNITQSLVTFGIGNEDSDVVLAVVEKDGSQHIENILDQFDGRVCSLEELSDVINVKSIMKIYKIKETEEKVSSLKDSIVSRIATAGIVSVLN